MKTIRQVLIDQGWTVNNVRTSDRVYVDRGGARYGTLEKDGVRLAFDSQRLLCVERGSVIVYQSDEEDEWVLAAILVDTDSQGQGRGTKAMTEVVAAADASGTILYIEPVGLGDKPLPREVLVKWYAKHGFKCTPESNRVMVRKPTVQVPI